MYLETNGRVCFDFCSIQCTLNVQTSKQRGKNSAVDRGPLVAWGPSRGTTGTTVNPALVGRSNKLSRTLYSNVCNVARYITVIGTTMLRVLKFLSDNMTHMIDKPVGK